MVCLITSIDFLSIQPFLRPLFSGQQELSELDYYFQNGGKTGQGWTQRFFHGGALESESLKRAAQAVRGGGGEYERGVEPPAHRRGVRGTSPRNFF